MASTKDIHDIMGMGGGPVQKPANKKKKKVVEAQPRLSGISREVQALMGDSVPPVQIVEAPKYKSKPSLAAKHFKPRHWDERPFTPGARFDGLSLNHWKRAAILQRPQQANGDVEMSDGEKEKEAPKSQYQFEEEFPMEKWDISIRVPQYTDEQYEKHFNTDDWSREETDYLMRLASEYDLRWILISDRYDPAKVRAPTNGANGGDVAKSYPPRTTEQLKLRYYQVAAQDLELRTPKSNMDPAEFQLWEKMRNFDAKTEGLRKAMAEKLFERTKDEAEEERTLLEELHRITRNEEDFINMRRDLYARLEAAPSLRRNERGEEQNILLSSAGLSDLLSRLFAKEKHLKRRTIPNGEAGASSATTQTPADSRPRQSITHRRDTLESTTTETQKKGSISAPVPKQLTKAEEEKYGVVHPAERLTSGVSFRHEKINRVTTAKSQVQTQKINAALTELGIPARLSMPTEKVCKEFERLVGQISLLLDARKTLTRVSEEVKTLEEMRRQRLGEPAPAQEGVNADTMDVDKRDDASEGRSQAVQTRALDGSQSVNTQSQNPDEVATGDGEPGPAIDEDDEEDAEGEDDVDESNVERTRVDDGEDLEDTNIDDSIAQQEPEEEEEEDEAQYEEDDADVEAEEEEEQEEEDEDDDDDEGTSALRRGAENNDDDEDVEQEDDEIQDMTMNETEGAGDDSDADAVDTGAQAGRPTSAGRKRGASVLSDASGTRSNRSGDGRKRKR
ncbi:swr complex subunit [Exophiala xenobiotica]|uniref:SWR1-complex protein 4 n=1 Tax=Lithohypha guttulata TaxID=1690604 RepID=A0ABR0KAH8_9EURO|nr:swr complex subunit [Lithohypha guttulata]KAK5318842.1 swr complex subunit [Exophiala xenobiotica]